MVPELHCLYSLNQQMLSLYPSMELKYLHPMPDNCSPITLGGANINDMVNC